ncbi:MAG: hypothetical protein CL900_03020 [Dehalococcoidia bacterium]|nr:hypothetical protein [Dehalococcoidia bacterium]
MISAIETVKAITDARSSKVVVATMTADRYWESLSNHQKMDLPIFVSIKVIHPGHAGEPFIGSTKNAMEKLSKSILGD